MALEGSQFTCLFALVYLSSVVTASEPACRSSGSNNLKDVGQLFAEVQQQIWKTTEDKITGLQLEYETKTLKLKVDFQRELDSKLADSEARLNARFQTLEGELKSKITAMQGELVESKTKLANIEDNLAVKDQSIDQLNTELEALRKELTASKDQSHKDQAILHKELKFAKEESGRATKRITEAKREATNLASRLSDFAAKHQSYARNISALFQEARTSSQSKMETIRTELGNIKTDASTNRKSIATLQLGHSGLQLLQSTNSKKISDLVAQQQSNKKELSSIKTCSRALNDEIKDRKMKDAAFQDELSKLRSTLDWSLKGFTKQADGKYYRYFAQSLSFHEAKRACENNHAHLAIDDNTVTHTVLKSILPSAQRVWLGATDEKVERRWRWINDRPVTKTFWQTRQPDNSHNEDCLQINGGAWNDLSCSSKQHFVCQVKIK